MNTSLDIDTILATDVGSTTSKAILIKKVMGEFRLVGRCEAPTTVEAPFEDVRVGVRNAVKQVEDLTGIHFLMKDRSLKKGTFYVSTSSAGGGLQIMVSGVIRRMTAESGERAALGAGAIVLDVCPIFVEPGAILLANFISPSSTHLPPANGTRPPDAKSSGVG